MPCDLEKYRNNKAVVQDCFVLASMIEIYCHDKHKGQIPLKTPGTQAHFYEGCRHRITLCTQCQEHLAYGEKRRATCHYQDDKPNCKDCPVHCYRPEEAKFQRMVMAYGGRRFLLHPHLWKDGIKHLIFGIRHLLIRRKKS